MIKYNKKAVLLSFIVPIYWTISMIGYTRPSKNIECEVRNYV